MNQMNGSYQVKDESMLRYKDLAVYLMESFEEVEIEKIDRLDNEATNELKVIALNL